MAKDFRPPYSVFAVLSNPYPSAAVLYLSNTAALKSLSTHGFPFRRLRRCVFWSDRHRTTDGGSSWLTRSSPPAGSLDRLKPLLERFAPEENAPTDAHTRKVWEAGDLVMDDVAEMGTRTSHKGGSLGEVQDFGDRPSFKINWRCHRMSGGGGHTIPPA
jgi:hypothetical protein